MEKKLNWNWNAIFAILALFVAIIVFAGCFNFAKVSGKAIYTVFGIIGILCLGLYALLAYLKKKEAKEEEGQRLATINKLATTNKVLADQVAQFKTEKRYYEDQIATLKSNYIEAENKARGVAEPKAQAKSAKKK